MFKKNKEGPYILGLNDKEVTEGIFEEKPHNVDELRNFQVSDALLDTCLKNCTYVIFPPQPCQG